MAAGLQIPGIEPAFQPKTTGLDKAMEFMGKSQSTAGGMQQNIPMPGKTVGAGLMNTLGGAGAGAAIGSAISGGTAGSIAPGIGTAIGAAVGLGSYLLS